jgi:hypothetical protein
MVSRHTFQLVSSPLSGGNLTGHILEVGTSSCHVSAMAHTKQVPSEMDRKFIPCAKMFLVKGEKVLFWNDLFLLYIQITMVITYQLIEQASTALEQAESCQQV